MLHPEPCSVMSFTTKTGCEPLIAASSSTPICSNSSRRPSVCSMHWVLSKPIWWATLLLVPWHWRGPFITRRVCGVWC